LHAIFFVLYIR